MEIAILIITILLSAIFLYYPFYDENKKEKAYNERKSVQKQVYDCFLNKPLEYNMFTTDEFKKLPNDVSLRIINLTLSAFKRKNRKIYGNNILAKEAFLNVEVDLNGCFEWNKTEEGHEYWKDLHINYFKRQFK